MNYRKYINSEAWQQKRRVKFANDGRFCQKCETENELDVHHLTYERLGNENLDDLIILCRRCHNYYHYYEKRIPATKRMVLRQLTVTEDEYRLAMRKAS